MNTNLIQKAKEYALEKHNSTMESLMNFIWKPHPDEAITFDIKPNKEY